MISDKRAFTGFKTILHILAFFALFLASDLLSTLFFDFTFRNAHLASLWMYVLRSLGRLVLTFALFEIYVRAVLKMSLRDFGIKPVLRGWNVVCALALPAFVVLVFAAIGKVSVADGLTAGEAAGTLLDGVCMALAAGVLEEMLFRGFVMRLLERRWGRAVAVIAPSFLFSLVHIPSMQSVSLAGVALLIVAGTLVGIMFSLVAIKSGSVTGSALVHTVWNLVMVTDVLHIFSGKAYGASIFSIALPTDAILITGGGFGAEASVIALAGYLIVILWMLKKRDAA